MPLPRFCGATKNPACLHRRGFSFAAFFYSVANAITPVAVLEIGM
jgi:hypothetical protein